MAMPLTWCKCQATKRSDSVLALLWEGLWPLKPPEMWGTPGACGLHLQSRIHRKLCFFFPQDSLSSLSLIAEDSVMPLTYCKTALKLIHFSYTPLPINAICFQNKMCSSFALLCFSSLGLKCGAWRGLPSAGQHGKWLVGTAELPPPLRVLPAPCIKSPPEKPIQGTHIFSTTYFLCFSILKCFWENHNYYVRV